GGRPQCGTSTWLLPATLIVTKADISNIGRLSGSCFAISLAVCRLSQMSFPAKPNATNVSIPTPTITRNSPHLRFFRHLRNSTAVEYCSLSPVSSQMSPHTTTIPPIVTVVNTNQGWPDKNLNSDEIRFKRYCWVPSKAGTPYAGPSFAWEICGLS